MHAYPEAYLDEVVEEQGCLFENVLDYSPGIDVQDFIDKYMHSKTRKAVDEAQPYVCTMSAPELWNDFLQRDHFKPKKGNHIGGFVPNWIGQFYAYYQWYWNKTSPEVIDDVPLAFLLAGYPGLHDLDLKLAVQKVGDYVYGTTDYQFS